jgi:hypothetical protein
MSDFAMLESVKSRFLKRALCLSKFTKSRLVYELTAERFYVMELRLKFELPLTENYSKFMKSRVDKSEDINLAFFNTPAFKNDNWKNPNCTNRNTITRFAVHGFHHVVCCTKEYHESGVNCICNLCGQKCEQYHLLHCPARQHGLAHYAKLGA